MYGERLSNASVPDNTKHLLFAVGKSNSTSEAIIAVIRPFPVNTDS